MHGALYNQRVNSLYTCTAIDKFPSLGSTPPPLARAHKLKYSCVREPGKQIPLRSMQLHINKPHSGVGGGGGIRIVERLTVSEMRTSVLMWHREDCKV